MFQRKPHLRSTASEESRTIYATSLHGLIFFWLLFFLCNFSINLFFETREAFITSGIPLIDTTIKTLWLPDYSLLAIFGYTAFNLFFAIIVKTKIDMVDKRISQEFLTLFTRGNCCKQLNEAKGIVIPKQSLIFPSTPKILFEDGSMSLDPFRLSRGSTDQIREFTEFAKLPILEK